MSIAGRLKAGARPGRGRSGGTPRPGLRTPSQHGTTPSPYPTSQAGVLIAATASALAVVGMPDRELTVEEAAAVRALHAIRLSADGLRAAIEEYRRDHDAWPGVPPDGGLDRRGSTVWLERHLTMASNAGGEVVPRAEPGYPYGPYLSGPLPANPANGRNDVRIFAGGGEPELDGATGWIYDPSTGSVWVNTVGTVPFADAAYGEL